MLEGGADMMKDRIKMVKAFHILADVCIIIIAYLAAYYVRFYTQVFNEKLGNYYPLERYAGLLVYLVPIYLLSYFFFRLYKVESEESSLHQIIRIVLSNIVGIIVFITLLYFQNENNISRRFLILFLIINVVLTIGTRILILNTNVAKIKRRRE
jgi:FlaA1/EpsC-like NDP-sugar epimerase